MLTCQLFYVVRTKKGKSIPLFNGIFVTCVFMFYIVLLKLWNFAKMICVDLSDVNKKYESESASMMYEHQNNMNGCKYIWMLHRWFDLIQICFPILMLQFCIPFSQSLSLWWLRLPQKGTSINHGDGFLDFFDPPPHVDHFTK